MGARVLLFCGEDDFGIAQQLRGLEEGFGSSSERIFNVISLDGRAISLEDLKGALYSFPMFATSRLVVLSQATSHFQNPPNRKQFLDIIAGVPESTTLVMIEPQKFAGDHWLIKWFKENEKPDAIFNFALKKSTEMSEWIQGQARQTGGKMTSQAAAMLASLVGDDSRQAYQEVIKLLTYVNYARPVDVEDVEAISLPIAPSNIFAMVDALGNRDGKNASALMHLLLEERDALSLFQMVIRQFRMILVARELIDSGGKMSEMADKFRLHEYVVKKVWSQARQFPMDTIAQIFHQLLELDYRIKMGELDDDLAMETFVAEFTSSPVKLSH
jgi:DNA polymerase-3 subunit delta